MARNPIIKETDSLTTLHNNLIKFFDYGFPDFDLCLKLIMSDLRWFKSERIKKEMQRHRKEKEALQKTLENFIKDLVKITEKSETMKGKLYAKEKIFLQILKRYNLMPTIQAIAKRCALSEKYIENSHLKSDTILKSHKIASIWAQVMKNKWAEISNLLYWFHSYYQGTLYFDVLNKEYDSFDPKQLARSYYHLRKNYRKEIEELRYICFEWEERYLLYY